MLRARPWLNSGHPFVCASCRQLLNVPVNAGNECHPSDRAVSVYAIQTVRLQRPYLPRCRTRSISTTAHLNTSNSSPGPGPSKFGAFPGAFSGTGGQWGSFAAGANQSPNSSPAEDGLLPHEREARLRSAAASTPPPVKPAAKPTRFSDQRQRGTGLGDRPSRRPNEAQVKLSRSVLADVFRTNRVPQAPPTPKSWLTGAQDSGSPTTPQSSTAKVASTTSTGAMSRSGASVAGKEPLTTPSARGHKGNEWGLFSQRKPEISHESPEPRKRANESAVYSGTSKSRFGTRPPVGKSRFGRADTRDRQHQTQGAATQDFWGELETRTTRLKDTVKKRSESNVNGTGESAETSRSDDADLGGGSRQSTSNSRKFIAEDQFSKQRRQSRFEEPAELEDRQAQKSKQKNTQKNRRMAEDHDWDDDAVHRWEQKQRRKAEKEALKQAAAEKEPEVVPIFLPEYISASNLSKALKQQVNQFLKDMEVMGFENVTGDTIFTGETAALIAMEYGFEPTVDSGSQRDLRPRPVPEDISLLPSRPPVVTIMGHVDHGKTTLLDWLRKSSVAAQEHGGITQHIGAFIVKMSSGKTITFLDTPGHAAFLSMRQRGANVTDIVVLVVAADDSVKPQTLEALKHAKNAKVPIIVAINKIDKEDAKIDQVKADLSRHGVEIEDFGGDVQVVCVSGKTGQGMEDLEENIVTLSEVLDVRAENYGMAEGWILESSIKTQGRAATVLVKRGTLRLGDFIVAGQTWARIRALRNESGQDLEEAPPGTPVEILGWRELPSAGEQVLQSPDERKAKMAVEYRLEMGEREQSSIQLAEQEQRQRDKATAEAAAAAAAEAGREAAASGSSEPSVIAQNFTVKADVVGSVEAVCGTILEQGNHEVQPKILRSSAGPITEYDVDHAAASNSIIVNFNCPISPHIKQRAEEARVQIFDHNVIYHVVGDVKAALSKLLPMSVSYSVTGEADVLQVFQINVKRRHYQNIAGCRVRNGSIKKSSRVRVLRRGEIIFEGNIDTLKHVKKDVQEMGKGTECGIGLDGFDDFQADDQIQTFNEIKEKRYL